MRSFSHFISRTAAGWLVVMAALAQTQTFVFEKEPARHALVIGTSSYKHLASLESAAEDARQMALRLRSFGFSVTEVNSLNSVRNFEDAVLPDFRRNIETGDLVVVYFSGHGFAYGPYNFLAPSDLPLTVNESDLTKRAVSVEALEYYFGQREPGLILFLIDACRSMGGFVVADSKNPGMVLKGSAEPNTQGGENYMVGFATRPGRPALGSTASGTMSPFTAGLLSHMAGQSGSFKSLFADASSEVRVKTNGEQHPGLLDWSSTDFFLAPTPTILMQERELWLTALATRDRSSVQWYLLRYALSRYAAAARQWLSENPESTAPVRFTRISPVAVDRAWQTANLKKAIVPTAPGFAFERVVSATADAGTLPDKELGLVLSGTKSAGRKFASHVRTLKAHGSAVATGKYTARATPAIDAPPLFEVQPGTKLHIVDLKHSPSGDWVVANVAGSGQQVFVRPLTNSGASAPVEIGAPLLEVKTGARSTALDGLADEQPLQHALAALRKSTVTWVSLAIAPSADPREAGIRAARLANVEYLLKQAGVDERRITSITNATDLDGSIVRVRFFGN